LDGLHKAFQDPEFRVLFAELAKEMQDPTKKKVYQYH
jgi:hypothetical protein